MKHTAFVLGFALLSLAASAQTTTWKESTARDHFEIIRETCFAGADVQDHDGKPVIEKLLDTEAYPSDLKVGDVITGIGDISVRRSKEWEAAMDRFKEGQKATVHVLRAGKPVDVTVLLRKINVFGRID